MNICISAFAYMLKQALGWSPLGLGLFYLLTFHAHNDYCCTYMYSFCDRVLLPTVSMVTAKSAMSAIIGRS